MSQVPQERFNRRGHASHRPGGNEPAAGEQTPRGELWGLCDVCDRWFFVAMEPGLQVRSPRCPVCDSVAARMSLRLTTVPNP